jgi:hypothetical protein
MSISGTVSASIRRARQLVRRWATSKLGSTHLLRVRLGRCPSDGRPRVNCSSGYKRRAPWELIYPDHAHRGEPRFRVQPPLRRLVVLGVAGAALLAVGCGDSIPAARATKATTPAPTIAWGISSALVTQSTPAATLSVPAAPPRPAMSATPSVMSSTPPWHPLGLQVLPTG